MLRLNSLLLVHCCNRAVSHAFLALCKRWQGDDLHTKMIVPSYDSSCYGFDIEEAMAPSLKPLFYRIPALPNRLTERLFLKRLKDADAAYLWTSASVPTYSKVKEMGKPLILERINCYTGTAKRILDDAYTRIGLTPDHPNTLVKILVENEKVRLADFVLCPSPAVKESFLEAGLPEHKLVSTSYGWCPERFPVALRDKPINDSDLVNILFVGSVCVRKGAHLLLEAWKKANIKGKLMLWGAVEPAIAERYADVLARPDVEVFNAQMGAEFAYPKADFFVFPTLEEGSPLVTYEAMAHSLPIITSAMGAGEIIRDNVEGMIVEPYQEEALIVAMRQLASSPDLRAQMSQAARIRAMEFTWDKVAARRKQQMLALLNYQTEPQSSLVPAIA